MAMKFYTDTSEKQIKKLILDLLEDNPGLRRKELIELCISYFDFSIDEHKNRSASGAVVRAKSHIGMLLTSLIANGDIDESEVGRLYSRTTSKKIVDYDNAADFTISALSETQSVSKQQLFRTAEDHFRIYGDGTSSVRALMGTVLSRLVREKRIILDSRGYRLPPVSSVPRTELGYYLDKSKTSDDIFDCFINAVHVKGGEWFESYAVELLARYYESICGVSVNKANVVGGSKDGGIDGIVETTDWLGFREITLMQMKNRSATMTERDIREFYGAVCAASGSRGLFITISDFHPDAEAFMKRINNLIGVDGKKLFEIAKMCRFGLIRDGDSFILDDELFLGKNL